MWQVMGSIFYKDGYKYQIVEPHSCAIPIFPPRYISTPYITLSVSGDLTIKEGYAFDGPSGPTIDTPSAMRGSLYHDVCYQLMRLGLLDQSFREAADKMYRDTCIDDGMSRFRAWAHFDALRLFGGKAASPTSERRILTAP